MKTDNEPNKLEEVTLETVVVILTEILGALKTLPLENVQYYDNADLKKNAQRERQYTAQDQEIKFDPTQENPGKDLLPKIIFQQSLQSMRAFFLGL